ncbi:zinc transporter 6-like isoform X1 [Tigriopus californicus]|uniref:zinc transporter 6-like isoform X1 n=1 Tax=Tigriopus californicus TaxID=6832 RepID=UPI0027D9EF38|nr:zinc transporter 6-like isoform X1 [Tigriopus californicus]
MNGQHSRVSTVSLSAVSVHSNHGHAHGHSHNGNGHHGHSHAHVPRRESFPFSRIFEEAWKTIAHPDSLRISLLLVLNSCSLGLTTFWISSSNSLALSAVNYLSWFHSLNLLTCYLTQWIKIQNQKFVHRKLHDISAFNLGHARFEVLAVFSTTILSQLGALFLMKEALERVLESPEVHTGRLMMGAFVSLSNQMLISLLAPSTALNHVFEVSSSSWIQEHTADIAHTVCSAFPPLSAYLLPRINPMVLLSSISFVAIFVLDLMIEINSAHRADSLIALILALLMMGSMFPLTLYTGRILLQTTPTHILPQLDRYLREALTIDGVLEFKNEHFWTVSFGRLAGSMTVRVRKDANEQIVLAHITDRLSNLVWPLTVQISKDDHHIAQLQQTSMQFLKASPRNNPMALRATKGSPMVGTPSELSANGNSPFFTSTPKSVLEVSTVFSPPVGNGSLYQANSIQPPRPLPESFNTHSRLISPGNSPSESAKLK